MDAISSLINSSSSSASLDPSSFDRTYKSKNRIYNRRLALAKAVQKRKHILFGNSASAAFTDDGASGSLNNMRRDAWEDIRQELLRKGFSEFASKTRLDIQKTDWQHVRRYVMDKRKKDNPARNEPITELDTVVFDIVKSFGRYSTRDSVGEINAEDNDLLDNDQQLSASFANDRSVSATPEREFKSDENGVDHLPQLSQLLNLQFQQEPELATPQPESDIQKRILEAKLQREQHLALQEKIRADIENEHLVQEQIKTKILLAQLIKENPELAEEFKQKSN